MARVLGSKSFPLEYMAKVAVAGSAHDLGSSSIFVRHVLYSSFDLVIKTGPAAIRFEFVGRAVKRRIAPSAHISAGSLVVIELACERALGSFVKDHSFLFRSQLIEFH